MCLRTEQEAAVVFDKISGKSKGYGFVTFTSAEAAMRALVDTVKIIDGRQTQVRSLRGMGFLKIPESLDFSEPPEIGV
jgi:hypothetical protein